MPSTTHEELHQSLYPRKHKGIFSSLSQTVNRPEYEEKIAQRLSEAVKIPTVVGDGMGHMGEDPEWEIFYSFSQWLKNTFALIYEHLTHTTVNEHAHLFTWQGTDQSLKPLLLMAHTDVVPVSGSCTDTWTYEPFSGHYDGKYIWGRGSEDDKSNVVVILSVIELLLGIDFKPARTIIVALGFDEEGGAEKSYGARCLAEIILQRYGRNGVELIFDEGMPGLETRFGREFALPANSEKGYLDVIMRINTPGGHSQEPPAHTGIGLLAQAIHIIEDNPLPPKVSADSPAVAWLRDAALYDKAFPDTLRSAFKENIDSSEILSCITTQFKELRGLIQTTTAVTIVHGGDKVNSLPESAYAMVNHRIAPHDSVRILKDHYISLLAPWAKKHQLAVHAFGENISQPESALGTLTLTSDYDLDPSPISDPTDPRFELLAGTIRGIFGDHIVVSPTILLGNTDTRYYWDLATQIYRMSPWRASHDPRGTRMHTVDERMPIDGLMEGVRFYLAFILNIDEYR